MGTGNITKVTARLFLAALSLFAIAAVAAEKSVTLKFATVAPRGSIYHRVLQEIGDKWRAAEGGNAQFIVYTDSAQGAEAEIMKSLGYRPVVLELSDILPSLQTGMIDTVPAAPLWALVGQFDRTAPCMLRINWVPIVGAVVMSTKTLEAMSPAGRAALLEASARAGEVLRAHRNTSDDEIIRALEQRGLKVVTPTPELERAWQDLARRAWPRVRGGMVPADIFDRVERLLAEYRGEKK